MAHIDYKTTIWRRIELDEDTDLEKVKTLLQENPDSDPFETLYTAFKTYFMDEVNPESCEYLPLSENDNQSTIEFYTEDGIILFDNGINE